MSATIISRDSRPREKSRLPKVSLQMQMSGLELRSLFDFPYFVLFSRNEEKGKKHLVEILKTGHLPACLRDNGVLNSLLRTSHSVFSSMWQLYSPARCRQ